MTGSAAIFPETLEDGRNKQIQLSTKIDKPSAVQRLAAPSQMLKTAVLDLIKYVDYAIPETPKLLQRGKSVAFVDQLSSKDASRKALANSYNYKGTNVLKYSFNNSRVAF